MCGVKEKERRQGQAPVCWSGHREDGDGKVVEEVLEVCMA